MSPAAPSSLLSERLDQMRWIAALAVCAAHLRSITLANYAGGGWAGGAFFFVHGFGHQAVMFFFVISGFLVGGDVLRRCQAGAFSWRRHLARRGARLYLVLVPALLLTLACDLSGLAWFNQEGLYSHGRPLLMVYFNISERLGADVLLGNLFFLQTILTPTLGSNTPLWSLANEAWYYLLAPLLILACLRSTPPVRRVACALGLLAAGCFVGAGISSYFIVWLFGAGVHLLRRPLLRHSWPAWLLAGGTCIAQRFHLVPAGALFNWAADTLIGVGVALLINHWMHRSRPAGRLAKTHQVLAGFSFSLYVCHWPIGLLLVAASQRFFGFGIQLPFTLPNLCFYLGVLSVVVLFCFLFSRLTEKHTASLQARLSSWLGVAATPRTAT